MFADGVVISAQELYRELRFCIGPPTFSWLLFNRSIDEPEKRDGIQRGPAMKIRPTGVIPPMTTPFTSSGEIDLTLVAPQVAWLIGAGCHGMAAGGSTGAG